MKITLLLAVFCVSLYSQIFTPIADTDTQSDTSAGTNSNISVSRWCTALIKFDLAAGPDSVGRALLRLYFPGGIPSCTLYLKAAAPDTWNEGGAKPAAGSSISSVLLTAASAGYADIDITPYVKTRMAANKIVSLALNSSISGWVSINSRQAVSNKPELVIAGSNGNPFAVTGVSVSPSRAFVYSGRSLKLSIQVFPDNAEDTVIVWKSSDTSIVRVNTSGEIYGVAQGNASVVATSRQNAKKDTCDVSVRVLPGTNDMSGGCNFWNIGWEGTSHFFKSGLNWATVSDPWNPVLISELQQAGMNCLRFMDWNVVNYSCV
ncbi:MAG: Ig-like domain-containing protein, partial [Fibrobacteres bacterium]|nr:Ig-like domain-containing protein [Fibrobacterota bacterium]